MSSHPNATPVCSLPRASACGWCHGSGEEPDEDGSELPCLSCDGRGVPVVKFDLTESRTSGKRVAVYDPLTTILAVEQGKAAKRYKVIVRPDEAGWVGGKRVALVCEDGRAVYDLWTGDDFSCDCPGATFVNADKANKRAARRGGEVYATAGCVHLDCCLPLARAGFFDRFW